MVLLVIHVIFVPNKPNDTKFNLKLELKKVMLKVFKIDLD